MLRPQRTLIELEKFLRTTRTLLVFLLPVQRHDRIVEGGRLLHGSVQLGSRHRHRPRSGPAGLLTLVVPISLSVLGTFEFGQILGQYLGVLFYGTACLTVGLFVSALTKNQIISFLATALILFLLVAVNFLNNIVALPSFLAAAVNWLSFRYHFEPLGKGLIELKDLFFFVIMGAFFLYLNIKVLVIKKWS